MSDLSDLNNLDSNALTEPQIQAILNQIDLDVLNLLRDGKLAAAKYTTPVVRPSQNAARCGARASAISRTSADAESVRARSLCLMSIRVLTDLLGTHRR